MTTGILKSDIKLVESQRMEDTVDGGGRITGNEILDGAHNSMFHDISDLDRAYGNVSMMKSFLHIKSPNDDKYFGANVALLTPPADPSVSCTLMTTNDHYDLRADARDRLERYLAKSAEWQGKLYGDQLEGQRSIRFYQRVGGRLPNVGEVLVLVSAENEQYVRIVNSSSTIQTFQVNNYPEFEREVVVAEISEPLRTTFYGAEISPYDTASSLTTLRETIVADAARYFGIRPIAQDIAFSAMTIKAEGTYSQLVPSSRTETPMVDLNAVGDVSTLVESGGVVTFTTALTVSPGETLYAGTSITPGSLSLVAGATTVTDTGDGDLKIGSSTVGTVDYSQGLLSFAPGCPSLTGTKTISFKPASVASMVTQSTNDPISEETRGYAYVKTLEPIPGPGSLLISYMVQGKWYALQDTGNGVLKGLDSSYGSGQLDFTTGSLQLTLGALPDVGSVLMYQWGSPVNVTDRKGDIVSDGTWFEYKFPDGQTAKVDSIVITDHYGRSQITETGGAGVIERTTDGIRFRPNSTLGSGDYYDIEWDSLDVDRLSATSGTGFDLLDGGSFVTATLAGGNLDPGSITIALTCDVDGYGSEVTPRKEYLQAQSGIVVEDADADGKLYIMHHNTKQSQIGTIDYVTGEVNITKACSVRAMKQTWDSSWRWSPTKKPFQDLHEWIAVRTQVYDYFITGRGYSWTPGNVNAMSGGVIQYSQNKGVVEVVTSSTFTPAEVFFDTYLQEGESVINNSLRFTMGGYTYVERDGKLYHSIDPETGSGTLAGNLDLTNGRVVITDWANGVSPVVTVQSFSTTLNGDNLSQSTTFRTPGAPIAPGSLYLSVLRDGVKYSVTAELDGTIVGDEFEGFVNYDTGVVDVYFTQRPMDVSSLKFNAVVYNYLPLDADLIGLDPIRLPSDGRVPIFSKGDVVVIHQTNELPVTGAQASQVIDTGTVRLADVYLKDVNGAVIGESAYTYDLDAGTVTPNAGFSTQDVTVVYRFEDLVLLIDVDISGTMRLAKPCSHSYQAGKAYVSSVCIAGDLWSRYSDMFDQQTWTGVWSDDPIGNTVSAQYNDADFPMLVDNQGAITERWYVEFTSTTAFRLIGEHVGQIAVGSTSSDFAPTNPNTGKPYFTLPSLGWGSGWSTGNVLRFNTHGAIFPFWTIRTILQNDAVIENDKFALQLRGNVNKD